MKDIKSICRKLLFPPIWVIVLLTVFSATALALIFSRGMQESPVAYAAYVISAYWITVLTLLCSVTIPKHYKAIKEKVYANKYANRYINDPTYKIKVSLLASLTVNMLYVVTNVISGINNKTAWFLIFAAYYGILAIMRFLLLRYTNKNNLGENLVKECRRSRACAVILMALNLLLSGSVLMMVLFDRGFDYQGIMIYVMAMYTFYVTTLAIVNIVRYRKYHSPVMTTSKVISLAAALVSMLSLETAMFSQFGADMSAESQELMIIVTGAGIAVAVVVMSVYIIVSTTKKIKTLKQ